MGYLLPYDATMKTTQSDGQYSAKETARRVKAAVQGAFAGPPTPLKDIPKKNGESRTIGQKNKRRISQSKKTQKNKVVI
jgi:hypothetical protein